MSERELRRGTILLIGLDATLALVYLMDVFLDSPSWTLHQLVNLDAEGTVAAWYTSAKLLLAGVLFLVLAARTGEPVKSGMGSAWFYATVGLAFLMLSLDETASLHEKITSSLRRFEGLPRFSGDHGMWIPFLVAAGAGFAAATGRSWRRLWRHERRGTLLMGAGLALGLMGAVSLEIVSYELLRPANVRALYVAEVALEEELEMLGATLLLVGTVLIYRTGSPPVGAPEASA